MKFWHLVLLMSVLMAGGILCIASAELSPDIRFIAYVVLGVAIGNILGKAWPGGWREDV